MPRRVSWGLPGGPERRSSDYVWPESAWRRLPFAAALGLTVIAGLVLFEVGGRWASDLRRPLMPGSLVAAHSTVSTCESCHVPARGVSNFRCRRCHDESGPGRMTQAAHVGRHYARLGSAEPRQLEEIHALECVRCHVDHRGREANLVQAGNEQCVGCHGSSRPGSEGPVIGRFSRHPELRVLEQAGRSGQPVEQVTGIFFSHEQHAKEVAKELRKRQVPILNETRICNECHRPGSEQSAGGRRDFETVTSERHCFNCHAHREDLRSDPVNPLDAVAQKDDEPLECPTAPAGFTCTDDGRMVKQRVVHKDEWVLKSARRLRRELYPEAHARDHAATLARVAQLRRRLFLAQPLATLVTERLQERRQAFSDDLRRLDERAREHATATPEGTGGVARVEEVVSAARTAGEPEADALQSQLDALRQSPDKASVTAFDERREELLQLLDGIGASEAADGARKSRAAYLRLRLLSLLPGEAAGESVRRAQEQRREDVERVEDELVLRGSWVPQAGSTPGLPVLEAALQRAQAELRDLSALEAVAPAPLEARERKEQSLRALLGQEHDSGCAKCHQVRDGALLPVTASRPVLTLASFMHEPHLRAAPPETTLWRRLRGGQAAHAVLGCASCHGEVAKSKSAGDLHLKSIDSCRECHTSGAQRQDCVLCHRYHPPTRF